ncbi:putative tRNA (cytidine(34)-2'-O)-methyltransferase [Leptospira inadai serovar Lyme str. 10]|uniref:Putative tRNA (cytidine(34)-2'-O)-methyltransferase n=2 Tax=Leptospira inadai serovar Lyme TaxID=293084 RepID=V6HC64_9LEPT|nr:tRNA (cytidine(34)-2'-O)-methyltransferase [Leptospira inadai]EQA37391.1 putative tRNA (cytidine(34)-2'-O)-methyltransferase [Leptospira inadai serovar Lyme str. 10]PNV74981.1 rRNA methyltransferase [Leptospira inadai serovar Lyme]
MALRIALYRPEIPPNTGNIARLCVALGAELHIVGEPAFELSEKAARRAGLDYWDKVKLTLHSTWEEFRADFPPRSDLYLISTKGVTSYTKPNYGPDDTLLFGNETSGLPPEIMKSADVGHVIRIPMEEDCRCLNLSNAVAIVAYEVLRQVRKW